MDTGASSFPAHFRSLSSARTNRPATRPKGPTLNRIARSISSSPARLVATIVVALCLGGPALAQGLSETTVGASPVTTEMKGEIAAYVADHQKGLTGDAAAIRKAKNALVDPVKSAAMSESFRREYGTQLVPIIGPLTTNAREEVALNAVRIAGTLGTKDGLDLALKALDDKRESVRMMGAMSTGLAIATGRIAKNRALSQRNAGEALDALNTKAQAEQNPHVLDAMMLALDDAMRVKAADLEGVRTKATNMMLAHAGRLARDPKGVPGLDDALAHATKALGEAMLETGPDKLSPPQVQEAGGVAGDVVARILRQLEAGLTEADRNRLGLVAKQCEAIVQRGTESLAEKASVYNLDDLMREGKDAEFRAAAQRMFHDLTGKPFDRKDPADRYPAKP